MTRRGSSGPPGPKPPRTPKPAANWRGEDPNLELEKSRYADPIASRELLLKHLREAPEPLSAARLAHHRVVVQEAETVAAGEPGALVERTDEPHVVGVAVVAQRGARWPLAEERLGAVGGGVVD